MSKKIIPDNIVNNIPIIENKEIPVDLKDYSKKIIINLERNNKCYVRESVAIMLSQAQSLLPKGILIKVIEGFRSISLQKKLFKSVLLKIKKNNPKMKMQDLILKTSKFIANPEFTPPHTTGGAVDITLANKHRAELNMGTKINTLSEKSSTYNKSISNEAKKNRALLISVMEKIGFVNYLLEWWHWSYGDQYWAAAKKKRHALYGILKNSKKLCHNANQKAHKNI